MLLVATFTNCSLYLFMWLFSSLPRILSLFLSPPPSFLSLSLSFFYALLLSFLCHSITSIESSSTQPPIRLISRCCSTRFSGVEGINSEIPFSGGFFFRCNIYARRASCPPLLKSRRCVQTFLLPLSRRTVGRQASSIVICFHDKNITYVYHWHKN